MFMKCFNCVSKYCTHFGSDNTRDGKWIGPIKRDSSGGTTLHNFIKQEHYQG